MAEPDMQDLLERAEDICLARGWSLGWRERGCYLHLEASELTEAVRGKRDSEIAEEGADVLFVLLTFMASRKIPYNDMLEALKKKIEALEDGCPAGTP